MKIPFESVIFAPGLALVGKTSFTEAGFFDAVDISGLNDVAAAGNEDTPLGKLTARILRGDANGDDIAEFAGRQCYRSWVKGRSSADYHANVVEQGHGSIYEHASMQFQITGVSRSLTHELIRHRVGVAISQESQRYVPAKDIRFVVPPLTANRLYGLDQEAIEADEEFSLWREGCGLALNSYGAYLNKLMDRFQNGGEYKGKVHYRKRTLEAARSLLPNAAETRLLFSVNLRELRHLLTLRGGEPAELEIRRLACAMLSHAKAYAPNFFADVKFGAGEDGGVIVDSESGRI